MISVLSGTWSAYNEKGTTIYLSNGVARKAPATLANGATLIVQSGATVSGLTGSNAVIHVLSGGALVDSDIANAGIVVSSGGVTQSNRLNSTETVYASGARSLEDTWFNSGYDNNWAIFANGATVTGATVSSGGYLQVQNGAAGADITVSGGGSAVFVSGTVNGFTATGGGYVQSGNSFHSGLVIGGAFYDTVPVLNGTWSAVALSGATVYSSNGTTVAWPAILGNGAALIVESGAVASGMVGTNVSIQVRDGGTLLASEINNGAIVVLSGGVTRDNALNSTETNYASGARSLDDTWFNSGYDNNWATFANGATVTGAQVSSGGYLQVQNGGRGTDIIVAGGGSAVFVSGTVTGFKAIDGGNVQSGNAYYSGMTLEQVPQNNVNILYGTWSAVSLSGATVFQSGAVSLQWPVALGNGASLLVQSGAVASGIVGTGVAIHVQNGGTLSDSKIDNGAIAVYAGGTTRGNALNSTETNYASGARSLDDVWFNSGYDNNWAIFTNGASVQGAQVLSGGYLQVQNGGSGRDLMIADHGSAVFQPNSVTGFTATGGGYVQSGNAFYSGMTLTHSTYDNVTVLNGSWSAVVLSGETVYQNNGTTVRWPVAMGNGASLIVQSGAVVSGLTGQNVAIHVSSGGTLLESEINNGAIAVYSGGLTRDNALNSTETTYASGARSFDDTWFNSGYDNNWATFTNGASVQGAQVLSGGYLQVQGGGSGQDIAVASGGSAVFVSGTVVGFAAVSGGNVQSATRYYSGMSLAGSAYETVNVLYGTWSAVNSGGATVFQSNGLTLQWPATLGNGAALHVMSGAVASGMSGYGAAVFVSAGGTLENCYIYDGGVNVFSGGVTRENQFNSIPTNFYSGASSVKDVWYNSGYGDDGINVLSGAYLQEITVGNGALMNVQSGVRIVGDVVVGSSGYLESRSPYGGAVTIPPALPPSSGTTLAGVWSAVFVNGATVYQSNGATVQSPVALANGAVLYVMSDAVASGLSGYGVGIHVSYGGTLTDSYIRDGGVVVYGGGTTSANAFNSVPTHVLPGARSVDDVWYNSGYGDDWVVVHQDATAVNPSVGKGGIMYIAPGAEVTTPSLAEGAVLYVNRTPVETCFVTGAMIRTVSGARAVETLSVGDMIACREKEGVTYRPVTWIGSKETRAKPNLPLDQSGLPVRIHADAFGEGRPSSDLLVTAEHCFLVDGRFVPVRMLVNGRSIRYDEEMTAYSYHHIGLDRHSVIFANDLETESYLDTGNSGVFDRQTGADGVIRMRLSSWEHDAAAPLETGRHFVEPIFRALQTRAEDMAGLPCAPSAPTLTEDPGLRLVTGAGTELPLLRRVGDIHLYRLPAGTGKLWIVSHAGRPCDLIGPFVDDRRALGVRIGQITHYAGEMTALVETHLREPALAGWHGLEGGDSRWTDGHALIPLDPNLARSEGLLGIALVGSAVYAVDPAEDVLRRSA
ncbi:Hint domain-containing protein [Swaminathania salitolerans]|uniref:Hedgehog/Intein (Hint) domain-containing protein n=1 Tax=Swaminathania salitolerans TaxID=182838 RepID=A0A511BPZ1_9PROT|nr:Hint domain-containing protein [Swaminathania salitolerans]GBQ11245.1 hypothetical protein AA21291_0738 [Swaminathania salitolerans LMG 21291]GEL02397.1 hypothetical protein SSA02_15600 [Swaminathania salitolerans]